MNIYDLKRTDYGDGSSWYIYDCADGFIIAAQNEEVARKIASDNCGDEGPNVWIDCTRSTIDHIGHALSDVGGMLMRDFHAG